MVRNLNASVIVPLALAFVIGVMIYLYGTAKSQFNSAEEELRQIKKDLADARSEKESLRYELDMLTDQLEQISKDKTEALQRAESAEEIAHKANDDVDKLQTTLNTVQEELHKAHEHGEELQGNRDKMKGDLTAYISKWKQCEIAKKDVDSLAAQKAQESETALHGLREELLTLRTDKTNVERKLNEMEQSLRVCESKLQSIRASSFQRSQKQRGPAIDDRSVELLPPVSGAKDPPANTGLSRPVQGVARPPGAMAVGERKRAAVPNERLSHGGPAVMGHQEPPQRQSQLNFDPHEELPNNNIMENNQEII